MGERRRPSSPTRTDRAPRSNRNSPNSSTSTTPRSSTGGELGEGERLGHVVVGADAEADDLVQLAVARAQHQHGGRGLLAEDAADLEAAELGEHQVEHDEIRAQLPGLLERLDTVGCLAHLVSLAHEIEPEGLSDDLLVLDHQDVLGSHDTG